MLSWPEPCWWHTWPFTDPYPALPCSAGAPSLLYTQPPVAFALASSQTLPSFPTMFPLCRMKPSFLTASLCIKSCAPASSVCFTRQASPTPGVLHAYNLGGASTCQLSGQDESPSKMLVVASLPTLKDGPLLGVREEPVPARS